MVNLCLRSFGPLAFAFRLGRCNESVLHSNNKGRNSSDMINTTDNFEVGLCVANLKEDIEEESSLTNKFPRTPPRGLMISASNNDVVSIACKALSQGQVIAVPTDTIYGIACLAQSQPAIEQVYSIKHRDKNKPICICVATIEEVVRWSKCTISKELLHELLPGPVSVVFERTIDLNPKLNPQESTIGIRVPDDNLIRKICSVVDQPIALTSANISNQPSALEVKEFRSLWPLLDVIIDAGKLGSSPQSRLGSTIVNLQHQNLYQILRPGSALQQTRQILKRFDILEMPLPR